MAIKANYSGISIDNSDAPFGGSVTSMQYSVSFSQEPSSIQATIANETGVYDTPELNSEDPMLIKFGSKAMKMLPISYKKSRGSRGKTISVTFEDMSVKYLDKTLVLLKGKHVTQLSLPRSITLGQMFIPLENGGTESLQRYFGAYKPDVKVKYDIRELANGILSSGIPISESFFSYLEKFKSYSLSDSDVINNQIFMRDDSGALRDVLSSIAGELGFVFFWNNEDSPRVRNSRENEGFLDFVEVQEDIDIDMVNATILSYTDSCNILDDSEEVSIKNSYLKGAVGSFESSPVKKKSKSEPFARFKFRDYISSTHTGLKIPLVNVVTEMGLSAGEIESLGSNDAKNARMRHDMELLMKASLISSDFYVQFVALKLAARSFDPDYDDSNNNLVSGRLLGRNQKANADPDESELLATYVGKWFYDLKASQPKFPLNITRNLAVEALYDFSVQPVCHSENDHQDLIDEKTQNAADVIEMVKKETNFINSLKTDKWVACLYDSTVQSRQFFDDVEKDHVYNQVSFMAKNFGRWYYSVQRTSGMATINQDESDVGLRTKVGSFQGNDGELTTNTFTERPSLFTQRTFSQRDYTKSVSWLFSDTAVTDTALSEIFQAVKIPDLDFSTEDYFMVKDGQSQPSLKTVPQNMVTPLSRVFTVAGYDKISSVYSFLRNFNSDEKSAVTSATIGEDSNYTVNSQNFLNSSQYKSFSRETLGSVSTDSVPLLSSDTDYKTVGSVILSQDAVSIPQKSYDLIQHLRKSCNGEIYEYPEDLDYGIILHDAHEASRNGVDIDAQLAFHDFEEDDEDSYYDFNTNSGKGIFVIEIPASQPVSTGKEEASPFRLNEKLNSQFDTDSKEIFPDEIDIEVHKVNLPFSLANVNDRVRIGYSFTIDDVLIGLRSSLLPNQDFDKVTKVEIEDVSFDLGELTNEISNPIPTEFPLCSSSDVEIDLPSTTSALEEILKLYIETNIKPSISRSFQVSGFGFGDDNDMPSILEGLESVSIAVNQGGIITSIKIGNKRRNKAAIDLRRSLLIRSLSGGKGSRLIPDQIGKSFSNTFMVAT